jgi:hypothetical protein
MRILLAIFLLLAVTRLTLAQDTQAILESSKALEGALRSSLEGLEMYTSYIPGYGLHISMRSYSQNELPVNAQQIASLLAAMPETVSGLTENDWLSVYLEPDRYVGDGYILVRTKPNQPETLEVFLNGVKQ